MYNIYENGTFHICHMHDTYMQTYMVFICTLYVCIYVWCHLYGICM